MKSCVRPLAALFICMCLPATSFAHSVYIFAWVDGARICTESYFTPERKVRGEEVLMSDSSGQILAKGVTGEDGLFCFALPARPRDLEFTVLAGVGHKGSFTLEERELANAINARNETAGKPVPASPQEASSAPAPQAGKTGQPETIPLAVDSEKSQIDVDSEARIRGIVREELQKQLSPMRQYLAEKLEDKTPGIREVVGGIGWLAGLGAFGFWCSQRRKKQ